MSKHLVRSLTKRFPDVVALGGERSELGARFACPPACDQRAGFDGRLEIYDCPCLQLFRHVSAVVLYQGDSLGHNSLENCLSSIFMDVSQRLDVGDLAHSEPSAA